MPRQMREASWDVPSRNGLRSAAGGAPGAEERQQRSEACGQQGGPRRRHVGPASGRGEGGAGVGSGSRGSHGGGGHGGGGSGGGRVRGAGRGDGVGALVAVNRVAVSG